MQANQKGTVCVIGAGIIGCAVSRAFAQAGFEVIVVDPFAKSAQGTTSRNSEVIHAGIYYPTDTLKARLCVEGSHLLYEYCLNKNIPHRKIGKIIFAHTKAEHDELEKIHAQAKANDVHDLYYLSTQELATLEPHLKADHALYSPETGIISAHDYCYAVEADAVNMDATFVYKTLVTGLTRTSHGWQVTTNTVCDSGTPKSALPPAIRIAGSDVRPPLSISNESFDIDADIVVNAAGLYSDWISALAGVDPDSHRCALNWVKGEYFSLAPSWGKKLSHLIYPVPEKNHRGLGVHVTIDMGGQAKLGPNVVEIDRGENYSVDKDHLEAFFLGAIRFLPALQREDLSPAYSGIRPKLSKAGEAARDFYIREETEKGAPGFVNLLGIESPGLTSALAIGKYVLDKVL